MSSVAVSVEVYSGISAASLVCLSLVFHPEVDRDFFKLLILLAIYHRQLLALS